MYQTLDSSWLIVISYQ